MIETRCERGADIARMLDLSNATAAAIRNLDEHWDGQGMPMGVSGDGIPLLARICCLAQTVEVFLAAHGQPAAYEMARSRSGTWFDPALVNAMESFEFDAAFWASIRQEDVRPLVAALEPKDRIIVADASRIDQVAEAFARVIDAKSPYTGQHSGGVARIAIGMAAHVGLPREERTLLRRAALLHDIGKLGVSNLILDKPDKLTETEMAMMRQHPRYTDAILGRVRAFRDVASVAARHHERLDGTGISQRPAGREAGTTGPDAGGGGCLRGTLGDAAVPRGAAARGSAKDHSEPGGHGAVCGGGGDAGGGRDSARRAESCFGALTRLTYRHPRSCLTYSCSARNFSYTTTPFRFRPSSLNRSRNRPNRVT